MVFHSKIIRYHHYKFGMRFWYKNLSFHRSCGPAVIYISGYKVFWEEGILKNYTITKR
jgi:hypothetical protein